MYLHTQQNIWNNLQNTHNEILGYMLDSERQENNTRRLEDCCFFKEPPRVGLMGDGLPTRGQGYRLWTK